MKLNPYLAIILAATMGGIAGLFVKTIGLPSTSLTFFRMFVPAIILLVYFHINRIPIFKGNFKLMLLGSAFNAARMFLFFVAYIYTSMANAVIMLFTWPIFAAILGVIILKEKVTKRTFALILMAFFGIIVMYSNKDISFGSKDFIGMFSMLLSALLFSLATIIFKKEINDYSLMQTIFYQNLVGAVIFIPFIFINKPFPNLMQFTSATIYGFIIGIGGFYLFFYALKRLKMSHYSLFTYWEVIVAVTLGVIFLGEPITIHLIIGGLLIITSGYLLKKEDKKKDKKREENKDKKKAKRSQK